MAKSTGSTDPDLGPPFPPPVPSWVANLSPAHQMLYYKATLTYTKAHNALDAALATAKTAEAQPVDAFNVAMAAEQSAQSALDGAIGAAKAGKATIEGAPDLLDPSQSADASVAADQIAARQAAVDSDEAAVAKVAQRVAALDAAVTALKEVSQPQSGDFNPADAQPNADAVSLAQAQYEVDSAMANERWLIAQEDYEAKLAELRSYATHD